jgi:hypothetical protein
MQESFWVNWIIVLSSVLSFKNARVRVWKQSWVKGTVSLMF